MKRTRKELLTDLSQEAFNSSRMIANNTAEYVNGEGARVIRLHDTDIMVFTPDNKLILNSGGWKTKTTKRRIEDNLPRGMDLVQRDGLWYVGVSLGHILEWPVFYDGMTIRLDNGDVEGAVQDEKQIKELRYRIDRYAKAFVFALQRGEVPPPGPGDCWFCAMENTKTGKPLGEDAGDTDHLHNHLEEHYFVPSLLVRAVKLFYNAPINMDHLGRAFHNEHPERILPFFWKDCERAIKKYFFWQMGLPY